ncbi:MAG: helix-hairpin-helix domain-containing protein [Pseudomonadales bacterium]
MSNTSDSSWPKGVARPAQRALAAAGITTLAELARRSEAEVTALHGMGPKAIEALKLAMAAQGLTFRR